MNHTYLRGDMYYADLGQGIGSEQEGYRPIVVIQNNVGNKHSPTVIIASITSCEPWINAAWVTLSVTCPKSIYRVSITLWQSVSV